MTPDAFTFVVVAGTAVLSLGALVAVGVRVHAYWRRSVAAPPSTPPEVRSRLETLERAVDEIALEVERITEAQRFLIRLKAAPHEQQIEGLDVDAPAR